VATILTGLSYQLTVETLIWKREERLSEVAA
jgi:hypothetical protein